MKSIKYILFAIIGVIIISNCSDMDDYLKYTGGKELVYPGKVDSIVFHSGRERVLFTGLLISDPNIKKVGVYWNNKTDSVIIPVQRTAGIDSLEVNIPLPEGAYNFQVYSYDGEGHSSIVSNVRGNSYGATYENSLYDRPVKNAIQSPNYATINWYNGDPTCFVKVIYTDNNDKQHSVFVPASKDTTRLDYCKPMTDIVLQTYYLPDETAVDTFKVAQSWTIGADADMTETYIKNSGAGNVGIRGNFLNGNSEWGEPIDWIVTDPVKVNAHQHGWANRDGGVLHPETWGQGDFSNGKIYQVFNLPKGKYELAYNCSGSNTANNDNERARVNAYFVAAKGDLPPDIDVIESNSNTLAFFHGDAVAIRGWHTISFTLDADTEINIGFVFSLKNESQFRIKEFQLMYKAK